MDSVPQPIQVSGEQPSPATTNGPDLSGKVLGDFRILRRLGQGGMGQVYLAEQLSLKRKVALKIMRPEIASTPVALERFRREAEAVARVNHANIVQVHAIGVADGLHFMALEYVEGRNLREYLSKKGPPDVPLALSIMRQVAAALDCAHEAGIIHRDIKPENILLTRKGEVKVADFGLSRCLGNDAQALHLTQSGVSLGTPLYMSPEQVQGRNVDPRTDIYSFGVTCYHMLAGEPPFRGQSPFEVALQHVTGQARPLQQIRPDLPDGLCQLIHKMMAKAPVDRFANCREVLVELLRLPAVGSDVTHALSGGQELDLVLALDAVPTPTLTVPLARRWRPNQRLLRYGGSVLLILLTLGLGAGLHGWTVDASREPRSANRQAVRLTPSADEREAALRDRIDQAVSPGNGEASRRHWEAVQQLGLLYLEQRRWTEAEAFFQKLQEQPPDMRIYRVWGRIGQAVVLAFQDKPEESNKLFLEIEKNRAAFFEKNRPPGDGRFWPGKGPRDIPAEVILLHYQPAIRRIVAEALNRNAANLGETPLPDSLDKLRRLQAPSRWFGGPPLLPNEPARP